VPCSQIYAQAPTDSSATDVWRRNFRGRLKVGDRMAQSNFSRQRVTDGSSGCSRDRESTLSDVWHHPWHNEEDCGVCVNANAVSKVAQRTPHVLSKTTALLRWQSELGNNIHSATLKLNSIPAEHILVWR